MPFIVSEIEYDDYSLVVQEPLAGQFHWSVFLDENHVDSGIVYHDKDKAVKEAYDAYCEHAGIPDSFNLATFY